MRYPGGKFRCFQKLINLIPPHRVYIETHLGGGAVLRHKIPAKVNIGIDRDPEVVENFLTGFEDHFQFIAGKAESFLAEYAFEGDEFIYADPPYWPKSRRSRRKIYNFEYTEAEHLELLRILLSVRCKVMISGYANPAYNRHLKSWERLSFPGTSHTGLREESVWLNYAPTILHDNRYLGNTFRDRQTIRRKRLRWVSRFRKEAPAVQHAILNDLSVAFHRSVEPRNTNTP
jgi:site-specific DNA-adenine methylase